LGPNVWRRGEPGVGLVATILITRRQNKMTINSRQNKRHVRARECIYRTVHGSSVNIICLVVVINTEYEPIQNVM
jgi:hypothetical protein